jgi:predicted neuraminidase
MHIACLSVIDLEETEVAKLFATSLAPSKNCQLAIFRSKTGVAFMVKNVTAHRYSTHRERQISLLSRKCTDGEVSLEILNKADGKYLMPTSNWCSAILNKA